MAKTTEHFRASDVTRWGIVALVCWGGAVLLANVSALIPTSVFAGLHASRLEGVTLAQLRTEYVALSDESQRMRRENNLLLQRFDRSEEQDRMVTARVGALEVSLPRSLERSGSSSMIDTNSVTASIGEGRVVSFDAEGGSVSVVQKPMIANAPAIMAETTEMAPAADPNAFGLALGFPIAPEDAEAQWQSLAAKVGTLLIGLAPVMANVDGSDGVEIIAGPIADRGQAEQLCTRMDRVGIPCKAKPYRGEPLPLLN